MPAYVLCTRPPRTVLDHLREGRQRVNNGGLPRGHCRCSYNSEMEWCSSFYLPPFFLPLGTYQEEHLVLLLLQTELRHYKDETNNDSHSLLSIDYYVCLFRCSYTDGISFLGLMPGDEGYHPSSTSLTCTCDIYNRVQTSIPCQDVKLRDLTFFHRL